MTVDEFKRQYPFFIEGKVEWADLDAFQHVNNTLYFRYFERVRIEYFTEVGFINYLKEQEIGPILASTQCRFKVPLEYPDSILIGTYVTDIKDDRFLMKYAVFSNKQKCVAAEGDGLIVCYDYGNERKTKIPAEIKARLSGKD